MSPDTGAIAGRVVDAAGKPVSGATVAVSSSSQPVRDIAAITTVDGLFRFDGMRPGSYGLEAHRGTSAGGARVVVSTGPPTNVVIRLDA